MKNLKAVASSSATGVIIASFIAAPAFACQPQGKIVKQVQDVTRKSALSDANTPSTAVSVQPGDILTYTITVSNSETQVGAHSEDQMVNTVLTDTLPDGVEFVANPSQRTITEQLGTLKAKQSVTKQYQVKVLSTTTDGQSLINKACFTGNNNAGNLPQSGCDVAIAEVSVPTVTPPAPVSAPTPTPTPTPPVVAPTVPSVALPNTGPGNIFVAAISVSVLGYAGNLLRLKRRATANSTI